jgi:hypothetical protein
MFSILGFYGEEDNTQIPLNPLPGARTLAVGYATFDSGS